MAEEKELKRWVADKLHSVLGFSESAVASYIVSVAKKHTNADSLAKVLQQQGLPTGAETVAMAQELLAKMPRAGKPAAPSAAQLEARQAKTILKKNLQYGLLEAAPGEIPAQKSQPQLQPSTSGQTAEQPTKERKLRTKSKTSAHDDDEDDVGVRLVKKAKRSWEEDEEDEETPEARLERLAEAARLRDQQEKEEFEARLRQKDEQRTKKLAEESNKLSKSEQREEAKRKWVYAWCTHVAPCMWCALHGRP